MGILKVTEKKEQDPDPERSGSVIKCTHPRIRIRTKILQIRNTDILYCRRNNVVHMEMTFCNKAMQAMQAG